VKLPCALLARRNRSLARLALAENGPDHLHPEDGLRART
jgi:hypothetical protein